LIILDEEAVSFLVVVQLKIKRMSDSEIRYLFIVDKVCRKLFSFNPESIGTKLSEFCNSIFL